MELVFNNVDEFIEELKRYKDDGWLDRVRNHAGDDTIKHVVRLTIMRRHAGTMPLLSWTVVATTHWPIEPAGEYGPVWGICTLRVFTGEDMMAEGKAVQEARKLVEDLGGRLRAMEFDVRNGILQPTDRQGRP